MKKVLRRVIVLLPAVMTQLVWLILFTRWLSPYAGVVSVAGSVLSLLFVLYVVTKEDESTYKILWLLFILTLPLPGVVCYILFGNKRTTRPLRKKLNKAIESLSEISQTETQIKERRANLLREIDPRMAQIFKRISDITGYYPCRVDEASYYPLGDLAFPDMLEAMESAREFIFLEYFIIEKGIMWNTMAEIMSRKVSQGIDVRVMYDDVGSVSKYSPEEAKELRKKGIKCIPFNPLLYASGTINYRDHRKMLIVDGNIAFSGGINLADEYINKKVKHGHWKDIVFCLKGEAAANYTRMYVEFWNAFSYDKIPNSVIKRGSAPDKGLNGYVLSYYDSPIRDKAASNELYIALLSKAERYAWFYTPYLLPGDALMHAFIRAAGRGVDVRIIMPAIPDKKFIYRMSKSFYRPLLNEGVKIYEYSPGFIHAKASVIDDIAGTMGTVNLDCRSLFLQFENNSLFYKAPVLMELKTDFEETQAKCRQVHPESIKVGFIHWLTDSVLRVFAPLC